MNADVIAIACDALIKEDTPARNTRTALENIVGGVVEELTTTTVLDVAAAQSAIDWLLAVALKYTNEAQKSHWHSKIDRLPQVPKFATWAHTIWNTHLKGKENATVHHLDRLLQLSRGPNSMEESHAFLCAVLKDGLQRGTLYTTPEDISKLNIWEKVGELGMKEIRETQYQQLYATCLRERLSTQPWSTSGRLYFFPSVLDYVCNEQKHSLHKIIGVIANYGYKTTMSAADFTKRLIEHANAHNENIVKVLEEHLQSALIMDLFKDTGMELRVAPNQIWGVQQIDCLHKGPPDGFTAQTMATMWKTHSPQTRDHSVTLALLSKATSLDIKNKLKSLVKDNADTSVDSVVNVCLQDAQFWQENPPKYYPNAAQVVLKKLEKGSLWSELSISSHRAILGQLTTQVEQVLSEPLNDKGIRALRTPQLRTLGSHIHIVHRSLRANDGLINANDATVAKRILMEHPDVNAHTQLLNMVKLVEKGMVAVDAADVDALQVKLDGMCTAELLALASASVRPQAASPTKRRL